MSSPLRRSAPRAALLLATVLLLVLALGAHDASAKPRMAKALQDQALMNSDDPADRAVFWTRVRQAKVTRIRTLVSWDGASTTVNPDVVARLERAAGEGRASGAKLLVGFYAAVNRGYTTPRRITPDLIERFGAFTASVGTALQRIPLAGYLTWNEPNFKSMWPRNQPRTWVTISNVAYRSLKRTDPGTPVLVGEAAPNARTSNAIDPGVFFRRALCLDTRYRSAKRDRSCRTRLLGDGFTLHTHDFVRSPTTRMPSRNAWTMGNIRAATGELRRYARAGRISKAMSRNVHITEFAYRTVGSFRTPDARAARWLRDAWNLAKRAGIRSFTWYQLRDPGPSEEWRSGLLTGSSKPLRTWQTFRYLR